MGEFAAAAESVVMAAEDAAVETSTSPVARDVSPASAPSDPAHADPAPSAPAEGTHGDLSESRRAANGRYQRTPTTIPYARFNEVTKQNQTYKTENQALKERFGWLAEQEAPVMRSFYERFKADSAGALAVELRELAKSPQQLARLKQELRDVFVEQAAQAQAETPDPEPQPEYETDDGKAVPTVEYLNAWYAWKQRQSKAELEQELAPLRAMAQKAQVAEAHALASDRAEQHAKSVVTPMLADPMFVQHKPAIRDRYRQYIAHAASQGREISGELALHRAYTDVMRSVLQQQSSSSARAVAASLQAKPGASALNPARPVASAAAPRPTTFGEAAAKVLGVR